MKLSSQFAYSLQKAIWVSLILSFCGVASEPLGTPKLEYIEYPEDEVPSAEEIELGKFLFFDSRLSSGKNTSCATCHDPNNGFGDGLKVSRGSTDNKLPRHTPHLYNLAWSSLLFWDGRSPTLEHQVLLPIVNPEEMNLPLLSMLKVINDTPFYKERFESVYDESEIDSYLVSRALAAFVRSLTSINSPFDKYIAGNEYALSPEAKNGLTLFKTKANCTQCHDGPNFTDDSFHSLGVAKSDLGRGGIVKDISLNNRFKTPGLRNITLTAPYMHDGSLPSLEAVIDFYDQGGGNGPNKDKLMKPLNLTNTEKRDLIAFLASLIDPIVIDPPDLSLLKSEASPKQD